MKKIYCFVNGGEPPFLYMGAVGEDGEFLAGHLSSSYDWGKHDIGLTSDWKHELYDKHFGIGNWELEWVEDPLTHPGLLKAFELNQAQAKTEQENAS